jgi:hydroxypyruvate isomerase
VKFALCPGTFKDQDVFYALNKVKEWGYDGLEYGKGWLQVDLQEVARHQDKIGVGISSIVSKFFDLVNPLHRETYLESLKEGIAACRILGTKSIVTQTGAAMEGVSRDIQRAAMVETLKLCADMLQNSDIILELEPLNELNHPGHFLQYSAEAASIIDQVGSPNIKMVFDVYHQQITEGNVTRNALAYMDRCTHYHIADNPGRKQPGTGELNYFNILKAIQAAGYTGFVGLECGFTIEVEEAVLQFKRDYIEKL